MGKIRLMNESLANLIAAGEIVEGPFSVVRELLDNSLDAGATSIDVSIEEGGLRSIRVADNGIGMSREDAELCLERHATSKIFSPSDLHAISTRGFRGEALAAILSVADVRVESRQEEDDVSTVVHGTAGKIVSTTVGARRPGTTISVNQLFYNVPARRKDCASPFTEARRVLQVVNAFALANPNVSFTLTANDKELLNAPAVESTLDRIRQVHDGDFVDNLVRVEGERGDVRVVGYMTPPQKSVRRNQRTMLFVNGRSVTTYAMRGVLKNVLGAAVPPQRSVEAIMFVTLPVSEVDPNVKPDKSEVRFRNKNQVWAAIADAARTVLSSRVSVPVIGERETQNDDARLFGSRTSPSQAPAVQPAGASKIEPSGNLFSAPHTEKYKSRLPEVQSNLFGESQVSQDIEAVVPTHPEWIQQIANTFLLCPDGDSLLIIDQHSAHERIKYEEFKARYIEERGLERQYLAIPQTLKLSNQEMLLVQEMQPLLHQLGFEVTEAGPNEVWLHSTPAAMPPRWRMDAFSSILSFHEAGSAGEGDDTQTLSVREDKILQTLACRAAIKSGQKLNDAEMKSLLEALSGINLAAHDVHGRPGMLRLPYSKIGTLMGRSSISW